jgi:hypothetical protein
MCELAQLVIAVPIGVMLSFLAAWVGLLVVRAYREKP